MGLPSSNYHWASYHRYDCPRCGTQMRYAIRPEDLYDMGDRGDMVLACPNCSCNGSEKEIERQLESKERNNPYRD